ncbi:hypothetical protein Nepgr_012148 [Nepenthes gracilis]|uniref:Uncharacterized protein n=1 Tax=Nepenthes gracilis TaxID=150966 RepID=A0AAD3SGT2_NEPGR|nr:hypothetical protein Nepgr_012148 [Nepenthes gracilis]
MLLFILSVESWLHWDREPPSRSHEYFILKPRILRLEATSTLSRTQEHSVRDQALHPEVTKPLVSGVLCPKTIPSRASHPSRSERTPSAELEALLPTEPFISEPGTP